MEVLDSNNWFINPNMKLSEEIIAITRISQEDVDSGADEESILALTDLKADFFIAHNKSFDEKFYVQTLKKFGLYSDIPWLCTIEDFEHPEKFKCRKLSHLALDYGIAIDPSKLHRASADVAILVKMLEIIKPNFSQMLSDLKLPSIKVRAIIPKPWEDDKIGSTKASKCGFKWDGKMWVKNIKEKNYQTEKDKLGYEIKII
jgi:DNA polymerase III alpha subunit (gram-positive type)